MNTIRWITPRIQFVEVVDSYGAYFFSVEYGIWDFPTNLDIWASIKRNLLEGGYRQYLRMPWFNVQNGNPEEEERRFYNPAKGKEEALSRLKVHQFMRNFASIWNWRPMLLDPVLADIDEFMKEDPKYRKEFDRWYRAARQDPYRRPHFYRDFLKDKIPMTE